MSKIRKLYCFDKKSTKEMISFLNSRSKDNYINNIMFNPFVFLHHFIPLRFKYLPESYILKDKKNIKGLITVAPNGSPSKQIEIKKLLFEENCYEDACQLVQYAVSKYKAMGTASFLVKVDDYLPELIKMFITKCDFSQISYEKLWNVNKIEQSGFNRKKFRTFRNADSAVLSALYNESLLPHFRPLLGSEPREFRESIFQGLSYYNEYKYVMEDKKSNNIQVYISIKTADNENYELDIINSSWIDIDIDEIITFAKYQIRKRKKHYNLFLKTKKYTQNGEKLEQELINRKVECIQNQLVLTNSSAKIIRETAKKSGKYTAISQFYGMGIQVGNVNNKTEIQVSKS